MQMQFVYQNSKKNIADIAIPSSGNAIDLKKHSGPRM